MTITPAQITLPIIQGATFREPLTRAVFPYLVREECGRLVKADSGMPAPDSDRVPEDYTGCKARVQMRRDINSPVIHELTTENDGILLSGDTLTLALTPVQTSAFVYGSTPPAWKSCMGHVEVERPNGDVERQYEITFPLSPEGTR